MAVIAVANQRTTPGKYTKSYDLTKVGDADTVATIPHGHVFDDAAAANKGLRVTLIPLLAKFYLSTPIVEIDGTNVTVTCSAAGGSGDAAAQMRVVVEKIHSING